MQRNNGKGTKKQMKKYIISSIIFIAIISLFIYIQDNAYTTLSLFGSNLTLPNALWSALFLTLFLFFTIIFFLIIHFKTYIYKKNIQKDILIIIENIKNNIFYKNKTKPVKILNSINSFVENIEGLNIKPVKKENFEFLEDIEKLQKGEVIEIGKYNLNENNPWFIQNIKNRLIQNPDYAKEVLKKFKNEELKKEAFYIFAKKAEIKEILKYPYDITFEIIEAHIKDDNLKELLEKAKLTPKEEIQIAKKIYNTKTPDEELEILSPLKWGKSYLALKYEHIELAKEIIEANNLKFFEYFLKLKTSQEKTDIDEYLDAAKIF